MRSMDETLDLDDWRRRVALLYLTRPGRGRGGGGGVPARPRRAVPRPPAVAAGRRAAGAVQRAALVPVRPRGQGAGRAAAARGRGRAGRRHRRRGRHRPLPAGRAAGHAVRGPHPVLDPRLRGRAVPALPGRHRRGGDLWGRAVPDRHDQGDLGPRPGPPGRPGGARLQLRLQPVVRLQQPAGRARWPRPRTTSRGRSGPGSWPTPTRPDPAAGWRLLELVRQLAGAVLAGGGADGACPCSARSR